MGVSDLGNASRKLAIVCPVAVRVPTFCTAVVSALRTPGPGIASSNVPSRCSWRVRLHRVCFPAAFLRLAGYRMIQQLRPVRKSFHDVHAKADSGTFANLP